MFMGLSMINQPGIAIPGIPSTSTRGSPKLLWAPGRSSHVKESTHTGDTDFHICCMSMYHACIYIYIYI